MGTEVQQALNLSEASGQEDFTPLCIVSLEKNEFSIIGLEEPLWSVVKTMRTKHGPGVVLAVDDVVKLGRVSFKITALRTLHNQELSDNTQDSDDSFLQENNEKEKGVCRICLSDDSTTQNPLISPCKCIGSMKYIHLGCLQKWIASRMVVRNTSNCMTYSWKSMDCEICKSSFPFTIGSNDKDLELFKIDKPTAPFIVLEAIGSDRNSNRGVHVISISNDNSITLGRGHDADVRISDISVSRCHANVKFKDGSFIIEDNNSKFGTLIKSSGKLIVQNSGALVLQAGRTVLSMSTKNNSNDLPDLH